MNQKRVVREGIGFGMIAGVIFGAAELVAAAGAGTPIRMAASVVLGREALGSSVGTTFLAGIVVHLVMSAVLGLVYVELDARLPAYEQVRYWRQLGLGLVFGALVWLIGFEVVAPWLYPWFLTGHPAAQLVFHALFFGAPLGLMMAASERKIPATAQ